MEDKKITNSSFNIYKNHKTSETYNKPLNFAELVLPLNKSKKNKERTSVNDIKKRNFLNLGVSIITCTNRLENINNVFENYARQLYENKELIIILNNNKMKLSKWHEKAKEYDNVHVFQLDQKITLGECLNFGVDKSKYDTIAKFDDDDYYSSHYLYDSIGAFKHTKADIIGKSTTYVYFEKDKLLAIRNPKRENRYVYRVEGPTLIIKKKVFEKVKFRDKNLGEDVQFCKDCFKEGFKIYSHNKLNYVYIRHKSTFKHTWTISDDYYKKLCKIIGKVEDYKSYITKNA